MSTNEYIDSALAQQDLERLKFSLNLRNNPNDYNKYVQERVDQMSDEVFNRKRAAFQKAQIDLGRYMDMEHNASYYKTRSADVERLTQSIVSNNDGIVQKLKQDKENSKRQFEINEWYNYNKLETLFFLQVFFISSLTMAILIFFHKSGALTNQMAALLTTIILLIVVGLGVYRYYYTRNTRDPRLWHRRYFGTAEAPPSRGLCSNGGTIDVNLNDIIPKSVTECVDDATARFDSWQDSLEKEMLAYQQSGETPKSIMGGNKGLGSAVCSKLA
jgi:hypothetical protein